MSESHEVAYRELRVRVEALIEPLDAAALEVTAPATPRWRAHDVLSHLVGITEDVVNGRMDGLASDAWTQAQVDRRKAASAAELFAEWDEFGPRFETMLGAAPAEIAGQAVFDAGTHEHDLRNALGMPGARDTEAIAVGWEWIVEARTRGNAPAICFVVESGEGVSGVGDVVARVEAARFDLFRAVSGRRTAEEIQHFTWSCEPDASLLLAADFFSIPEQSIGE
jgi:hypothetical protein